MKEISNIKLKSCELYGNIKSYGIYWFDVSGTPHRGNDLPAVITRGYDDSDNSSWVSFCWYLRGERKRKSIDFPTYQHFFNGKKMYECYSKIDVNNFKPTRLDFNNQEKIETINWYYRDHNKTKEINEWLYDKNITLSDKNRYEIPDEHKAEFKLRFL